MNIEGMTLKIGPIDPSYCGSHIRKVLASGSYRKYQFYAYDYGTHPCCYVVLPENHRVLHGVKRCSDVNVKCHGGITFVGYLNNTKKTAIGWDYAHVGDMYAAPVGGYEGRRYFTDELLEDIKYVIDQLCGDEIVF